MTTFALSTTNNNGISRRERTGVRKLVIVDVDFADTDSDMPAQNDILEAVAIPANTRVHGVYAEVLRVEGAARNFAIGDGSNILGYITSQSLNSLASFHSGLALTEGTPNAITGYSNGKFYSAADTIDILAVSASGLTVGKLRVAVEMTCYDG